MIVINETITKSVCRKICDDKWNESIKIANNGYINSRFMEKAWRRIMMPVVNHNQLRGEIMFKCWGYFFNY